MLLFTSSLTFSYPEWKQHNEAVMSNAERAMVRTRFNRFFLMVPSCAVSTVVWLLYVYNTPEYYATGNSMFRIAFPTVAN